MRAGEVAVTGRLRPRPPRRVARWIWSASGCAGARPRIGGGLRADGTAPGAGVLRRRSGRLAWALWVTAPRGPVIRLERRAGREEGVLARRPASDGLGRAAARATLHRRPTRAHPAIRPRGGHRPALTLGLGHTSGRRRPAPCLLRSAGVSTATADRRRMPPATGEAPLRGSRVAGDFEPCPSGPPCHPTRVRGARPPVPSDPGPRTSARTTSRPAPWR